LADGKETQKKTQKEIAKPWKYMWEDYTVVNKENTQNFRYYGK